ncbi:MAG TPA: transposase, partial [Planctomycetota bacterium]|nr:transposase [Planctomycetota bacterium]
MTATGTLDRSKLPNDPEILKDMLLEYVHKVQERDERLAVVEVQLRRFRRWQFGQKTERVSEGQLIFAWHGTIVPEELPTEPEHAPRARRCPARGGYRVIPKDIPREVVTLELPPDQRACPGCRQERTLIGYEDTKQLDYHPASFFERILRRAKYACKPCEKHIVTAPLPVPVGPIERGLPGFGLIAQIIVAKYCDHIPLYRQGRIYGRHGVEIPRQTLCDWVGQTIPSLDPIV